MPSSLVAPVNGQHTKSRDLVTMTLADCPDYATAVAAGLAHGLSPEDALDAAWGKYLKEHADAAQAFGIANFYDGKDADHAMVNYSRTIRYLVLRVADLEAQVQTISSQKQLDSTSTSE